MAIPAILKGDDSGDVTITLADGHNYEGATLVVVFNGVTREFANLTAGGEVSLAFTADETAGMPLGTGLVLMRLIGPTGAVETVGNADARIKVTDCVAEVNAGGSFAVTPGSNPLDGVEGLGTRYTGDQLRAKINEVIAKLGGTVAALLLCALPCLGGVTVQTAEPSGAATRNVAADAASEMAATSSTICFLIILSLFIRPILSDFAGKYIIFPNPATIPQFGGCGKGAIALARSRRPCHNVPMEKNCNLFRLGV